MNNFKPLCVDLDYTLVRTDLLHETFVDSIKQNPLNIFKALFWLLKGRCYLKQKLYEISNVDIDSIPLNEEVVQYCKEQSEKGQHVYLVSASSEKIIDQFLKKFSFFSDGWGSSGEHNLKGLKKAQFLVNKFGKKNFEYIGDSRADLAVWKEADKSLFVSYNNKIYKNISFSKVFNIKRNTFSKIIKTLRPHQYSKNMLLFGALILSHQYFNTVAIQNSILAFLSFSLIASSIYILNDITDLTNDRNHKIKKNRPIPSGEITLPAAIGLGIFTNLAGFALSLYLPTTFTLSISTYILLNIFYSYSFKRLPIFDVILLSAFYMIRLQAGGFATGIYISHWLITFSLFIFLSLGFLKRYSELFELFHGQGLTTSKGRGYEVSDLTLILIFGVGTAQLSILSMILYLFSENASKYYQNPKVLFLNAIIIFYWITLMWFKGSKGKVNQDPVKYAITDRTSILCGISIIIILLFGKYIPSL